VDRKEILNILNALKIVRTSEDFKEILKIFPELTYKPELEALLMIPDISLIDYSDLFEIKQWLISIKDKINHKTYKPLIPNNIYHELEETSLLYFIESLEKVSCLIPNGLVNKFDILISSDLRNGFDPAAMSISLKINSNQSNFCSEIIHEIGHLIEASNESIRKKSFDFLKSRIIDNERIDFKKICRENLLEIIENNNFEVYRGKFIDPYMGRVYENFHLPLSEVISVGLQAYWLNPTLFLIKDPEHFLLIEEILKDE